MSRARKFVLVGDVPVEEPDTMKWIAWFEHAELELAGGKIGNVSVVCRFLGLDYGPGGDAPPLLYEVAAWTYPGWRIGQLSRFATRAAALAAFDELVAEFDADASSED
jgi:hypothetical protein